MCVCVCLLYNVCVCVCICIRDATIIDFVGTIIVWWIITVSRLLLIPQHKNHKLSLDMKVLFIAAFWNRSNTVTNITAQNNTIKKEKKSLSPNWNLKRLPLLCIHACQYFPFDTFIPFIYSLLFSK